MLENLTQHICVSRCTNTEQPLWMCYEPLIIQAHSKRQMWKRTTGLLSTLEMQTFLGKRYQSDEVSKNFHSLSETTSSNAMNR